MFIIVPSKIIGKREFILINTIELDRLGGSLNE